MQVGGGPAWIDPEHSAAVRVTADPTDVGRELAKRLNGATGTPWLARWQRAEERAQAALDATMAAAIAPTEPGVARALLAALPDGATLVVSSSMPVRDIEWYGRPRERRARSSPTAAPTASTGWCRPPSAWPSGRGGPRRC